jgi:hypothetical protein
MGVTFANSGSGDAVAIAAADLVVPAGYVSGSALADSSTYDNRTFATLGATPGVYVYTLWSGATADSFTVDIGVPVPEPASALLLVLLLGFVGLLVLRPRRTPRAA